MSHNHRKYAKELGAIATDLGYTLEGQTSKGHLKWRHRDGHFVVIGTDLGNWRNLKNSIRTMRHGARNRPERQINAND
jgi:hypothetical protein